MTDFLTRTRSSGCGYVGNWDVASYPHIHQPILAMVTFLLESKG